MTWTPVTDQLPYPSPAWKVFPEIIPRPQAADYVYSLEIMDRKKARLVWRDGIKAAWDHRCAYCNGVPIDDNSLTADHVIPKARGGQDLTRNIVPACSRCNTSKGSEDWLKWYQKQDFYCPIRAKEVQVWMQQGTRDVNEWWEVGIGDLEWCINQIDQRGQMGHQGSEQSPPGPTPPPLWPIQNPQTEAA